MPKEKITTTPTGRWDLDEVGDDNVPAGAHRFTQTGTATLAVGWNRDGRWVQVYASEDGAGPGEGRIFDVYPDEIDHLIRVLRRAKRQAFEQRIPEHAPPAINVTIQGDVVQPDILADAVRRGIDVRTF